MAEWSAAANHAVDVASTSPAILQSSHEVFSAALEQHATGHSITHFLDVLSNMLNGTLPRGVMVVVGGWAFF